MFARTSREPGIYLRFRARDARNISSPRRRRRAEHIFGVLQDARALALALVVATALLASPAGATAPPGLPHNGTDGPEVVLGDVDAVGPAWGLCHLSVPFRDLDADAMVAALGSVARGGTSAHGSDAELPGEGVEHGTLHALTAPGELAGVFAIDAANATESPDGLTLATVNISVTHSCDVRLEEWDP